MRPIDSLKEVLKRNLRPRQVDSLVRAKNEALAYCYRNELRKLAGLFGTDKWNAHWYMENYAKYFAPLRGRRLNILEIGIGGYDVPDKGGESLRMWRAYFRNSIIYGIDLYDKTPLDEKRIRTFQGSQDDPAFLKRVAAKIGKLDIVIDDGSHINAHVIAAFKTLFPILSKRGIYVVEDTQTAYSPKYGGSDTDLNSPYTSIGYFKMLTDSLNREFIRPGSTDSDIERSIAAVHFYKNMVFVLKQE